MINYCKECYKTAGNERKCFEQIKMNNGYDPNLTSLLDFLERNFDNLNCNIDYVVDKLKINYDYIHFITIKYFDCPPHKLLEKFRLEKFIHYLQETKDITRAIVFTGYNVRNFKKILKKRFGRTASAIKLSLLESDSIEQAAQNYKNRIWQKNDIQK